MKQTQGKDVFKKLCSSADVLVEPFRPGVMERLGLGPSVLMELNKRLVYARLSGFGQSGPLAMKAGHDINYLAVSGVLSKLGDSQKVNPPINLLGDFAGGGLICALGICMALFERVSSGQGQVIDSNIVEGTSYVSSWLWHGSKENSPIKQFLWLANRGRGENTLDGGAPFYNCYKTKDGKFVSIGALEPQFYSSLLSVLQLDPDKYSQIDFKRWPEIKQDFEKIFASKTQSEWIESFKDVDACFAPVIEFDQAYSYSHNKLRNSFLEDGTPRPSPLLSRTPAAPSCLESDHAQDTHQVLNEIGFSDKEIQDLKNKNVIELNVGAKAKL